MLPQQRIHTQHMAYGIAYGQRIVFPVGQDMHCHQIDMRSKPGMAQPELPYVRIGHRHRRAFPGVVQIAGQLLRRQLAPQQHFVADDQKLYRALELPRQHKRALQFLPVLDGIAREPGTQPHPHAEPRGDRRQRIQPLAQSVCPDAVRQRFEDAQVLFDLRRRYPRLQGMRIERRGARPPERRIGNTGQNAGRSGWFYKRHRNTAHKPPTEH